MKNMDFRDNTPNDHPLYVLSKEVNDAINAAKKKSIVNLGEILLFLIKPPYGLYQNI